MRGARLLFPLMLMWAVASAWAADTVDGINKRAAEALAAARFQEAEDLYRGAIDQARQSGKRDHPLAEALNGLGETYLATRRVNDAEQTFAELAKLAQELASEPAAIQALDGQAAVLSLKVRMPDAIRQSEAALARRKKHFGIASPEVAGNLVVLGLMRWQAATGIKAPLNVVISEGHLLYQLQYSALGATADGVPMVVDQNNPGQVRASSDPHLLLGPSHGTLPSATAGERNDRAKVSAALLEDAESALQQAVTIYEANLGGEHPVVGETLQHLLRLYKFRGKYAEAADIDERFVSVMEKQTGPDSKYLSPLLLDLARLRIQLKQFNRAEPALRRTIAIQEKAFGPANSTLVPLLQMHADVLAKLDRKDEAKEAMRRKREIESARK